MRQYYKSDKKKREELKKKKKEEKRLRRLGKNEEDASQPSIAPVGSADPSLPATPSDIV